MHAIVLARRDFRENDQLISLFALEKGKINALARGVKKILSKNSAFLEPFFFVEAEIIPGRELSHLTKAVGLKSFKNIRADFQKSALAGRAAAFFDRFVEEGEIEPKVFFLFKSWLEFVDSEDVFEGHFYGLMARFFKILGFRPVLDRCVFCKKSIPAAANRLSFFVAGGGLACVDCREKAAQSFARPLNKKDLSDWKSYLDKEIELWPGSVSSSLKEAMDDFHEYYGEKKLAKISEI